MFPISWHHFADFYREFLAAPIKGHDLVIVAGAAPTLRAFIVNKLITAVTDGASLSALSQNWSRVV